MRKRSPSDVPRADDESAGPTVSHSGGGGGPQGGGLGAFGSAGADSIPSLTRADIDSRDKSEDPQAQAAWGTIRRAALRSCLKLAERTARDRTAEKLSAHLLPLAEAIWRHAFGGEESLVMPTAPLPVSVLVDTLRRELLEELAVNAEKLDTATAIRMLKSIDAVGDLQDNDPTHRFVSRFLGAAGLEALVEVAHDMRSPLSSIVLLVETMRMGQSGPINEVQERQLALVYGASFGLSLMANDVIDLAKGDERVMDSTALPFSVRDVMQSVREIVEPIAVEKKLDLRMDSLTADWRQGYPTPLHRVLLNLTTNALKFTDEGFVHVAARQLSRTIVEFTITDSGKGIPEYLRATLFDAFRGHDSSGAVRFSSSGLGLAICKKLVRSMGGELTADELPSGSRFRFTIDLPPAARF